jgi:acyl transferase domain-containing protein/NADPH:quinone reductase-like Zn-dependent oxidoreductase/NAD(P)-dependent dehydrogenase (short-subunit alcohol dehydrogenase family)
MTQNTNDSDRPSTVPREPIAIIGIGCRFPGGVDDPAAFWRLLCAETDAITAMPLERFPQERFDEQGAPAPGTIVTRQGGFLDRIDAFDAAFFGIAPREAQAMDPQQRLLLETAWEAVADAGLSRERLAGSKAGVYIGMWANEYEDGMFAATRAIDLYTTTGGGRYAASGRISFAFDLQGPSLTVDTACSSSLVAVHLACQSLWAAEIPLALVGGVNLMLQPEISIGYSRSRMLSPDGRCKFGDAGANGYVRSEGCAVIVLKPVQQALAAGDRIYALIRGSAVNHDGHSNELLVAPSGLGQIAMLESAYQQAGVAPSEVAYVEAHGTGTPVGDPVELGALGAVLGRGRAGDTPCIVGSVKTNIGHTEAASGMAGLIKAVLCLQQRAIPASLHFRTPNPAIPWQELPLKVAHALLPLPGQDGPRYAGVNSFGVTGTNAHIVLEEAPAVLSLTTAEQPARAQLLALSAHTPQALYTLATHYRALLDDDALAVADLCYSAGARSSHLRERIAIVATERVDVVVALDAFLRSTTHPALTSGTAPDAAPKVVFVFSGQGGQWCGMGRELLRSEPSFRVAFARCDAAIVAEAGWSPLVELHADERTSRLHEIDVVQPLLFAIQVALAELWRSWGVVPSAVVGHSMGEVAAACIAGALCLDDAVRVICTRARLLRRVRGQGAMVVVELSVEEATAAIAPYADRLAVAVSNSARSTVIAGDPPAIDAVMAALHARGVFCRLVKVDVASHSPQVDGLLPELRAALTELRLQPAALPMYSTVTGAVVEGGDLDAHYWTRNLRELVRFADAVQQLIADRITHIVEISPHPLLLPAIEQGLQQARQPGKVLPSLRRSEPERASLLTSLAALYSAGVLPTWAAIADADARFVPLPRYPWQRERFWYDMNVAPVRAQSGAHPWLGHALELASTPGSVVWQTSLDLRQRPLLAEHRVREEVLFPATGFVELALAAARELSVRQVEHQGPGGRSAPASWQLEQVTIDEALLLPESAAVRVQLVLDPVTPEWRRQDSSFGSSRTAESEGSGFRLRIFSATDDGWRLHAEGRLRIIDAYVSPDPIDLVAIKGRCGAERAAHHVPAMAARGLNYGPAFRLVHELRSSPGEVIGRIALPSAHDTALARITVLDAALQLALAALPTTTTGALYLPVAIERLIVRDLPQLGTIWSHARLLGASAAAYRVDVQLYDDAGQMLAELHGVQLRQASDRSAQAAELMYELHWQPTQPLFDAPPTESGSWLVFAGSDGEQPLVQALTAEGERVMVVQRGTQSLRVDRDHFTLDPQDRAAYGQLLAFVVDQGVPLRGVIYAWEFGFSEFKMQDPARRNDTQDAASCWSVVELVRALALTEFPQAPRLWLLTRGAQSDAAQAAVDPAAALLWGLGRTIASEYPQLRCTLIDQEAAPNMQQTAALLRELWAGLANAAEDQILLRGGSRFVARLQRGVARQPRVEKQEGPGLTQPARAPIPADTLRDGHPAVEPEPGTTNYVLTATTPGRLDSLRLRAAARRAPGPGEIEVHLHAAGLNFIDVLKALARYPGLPPSPHVALGAEGVGVVVRVGADVHAHSVGDEVVLITDSFDGTSCLSAYVTLAAEFAVPRPATLSAQEAAGQPLAFLTAFYALHTLGRMAPGERVLIHAAAGGVGLAAVQLCQRASAEIYATVGSQEKRDYLRSLGVQHIFDSRSLAFADEILAATGGRGVDLALNSLTGEAIPRSLAILAPRGRFLEIGKRDIYANSRIGLEPFKRNLAFHAIDLAALTAEDPVYVTSLYRELMTRFARGELRPLPVSVFPIAAAADVFMQMAQARHIGKLVLDLRAPPVVIEASEVPLVRADATYLITGGLGGLGLTVAQWLVERGARTLALLSRGAPSTEAVAVIAAWGAAGVQVHLVQADVADQAQLRDALKTVRAGLPPLRGVFHVAGVLADATLAQMTQAQLQEVLAPKVAGAWNLHTLTSDDPLDVFVLFSSAVALLGLAGQANYAAANAYLDALAQQRRGAGLPALSINWGPWSAIGMAAAQTNRGERLAAQGLGSIAAGEALVALEQLLREGVTQAAVLRLDPLQWTKTGVRAALPLFAEVLEGPTMSPAAQVSLRDRLLAVEAGPRRRALLEEHVCEQLAQVLRITPERIERQRSLKTIGLDSLMALELRNRLEQSAALALSATLAWNYPTVAALSEQLAERMHVALDAAESPTETAMQAQMDELVPLSDAALEALLDDELAAIERLLDTDQE